jgi:hypothetical protein
MTGQDYADHIRDIVTYIRYYAPNARIVFVGYPEQHNPGDKAMCMNIFGFPFVQPRGGAWTDVSDSVDAAQRAAAKSLGVDFFDTAAVTAGHGPCSPDPWLNGFLDPHTEILGQPGHPTFHNDAVVSDALQRYLATSH